MPRLDERLCLALYTASRAMTARYRPALAKLGLTYPQYLVMVLLWEEGSSPLGRMGTTLQLESSTLSPLVKRLETMGLVHRVREAFDERLVTVKLTDRGAALATAAATVPKEMSSAVGLSTAEQDALVAELRALTARLNASTPRRPS